VAATAGNDSVTITVEDTGPGIPSELLPNLVFHRFRRADTARTRRNGKTGLGLAIVQAIAHSHGGKAYASNGPHGGAITRLLFPNSQQTTSKTAIRMPTT
jgi:signal transduction histidine kinase